MAVFGLRVAAFRGQFPWFSRPERRSASRFALYESTSPLELSQALEVIGGALLPNFGPLGSGAFRLAQVWWTGFTS